MIRIGQGWDRHRVGPERRLVLGGIDVPWDLGLIGHSDADVLLHAVTDAVLGALALGDIGQWFPDSDPAFAGTDSSRLLRQVLESPGAQPWTLGNLDATIVAQRPQLGPHLPAIRASVAGLFGADVDLVSVKAKTGENVGPTGRGEAIDAQCVVLLTR